MFSVLYIYMRILIDKAWRHFYMLWESLILCKRGHMIIIVLNIKGKHNFKHVYYMHIVEIPTQNREHLWSCTELSLERKEGMVVSVSF